MPDPVNRGLPMSMERGRPVRGLQVCTEPEGQETEISEFWELLVTVHNLLPAGPPIPPEAPGFPSPLTTVPGPQLGLSASTSPAFCLPSSLTFHGHHPACLVPAKWPSAPQACHAHASLADVGQSSPDPRPEWVQIHSAATASEGPSLTTV